MPSPEQIREARVKAGLTQQQAGEKVSGSRRTWQNWELGVVRIPTAKWELFQLKTQKQTAE